MLRRLALAFFLLFVLAQLPFTYLGLSQAAREGRRYLDLWYLIVTGPAEPGDQEPPSIPPSARKTGDPDQAVASGPKGLPVDEAIGALQSPPAIVSVEQVAPPAELARRRVVDLPLLQDGSELEGALAGLRGLPVDYVSVPPRPLRGLSDDVPVALTLQPATHRRLLLLAARPGLSWWFRDGSADQLAGLLILSVEPDDGDLVIGLPDSLPMARIALDRRDFPFLRGVLPSCMASLDPLRPFHCADILERRGTRPQTKFQLAEHSVQSLLGGRIASVSSAFADQGDRMIGVPEEIVDAALRERARAYLDGHVESQERARRHREILRDYSRRFAEERRLAVLREQSGHAPYRLGDMVTERPQLLIVSAYRGRTESRKTRQPEDPALSYEVYAARERARIGSITVEVAAIGPVIVVATAYGAVDWRFQIADGARVLGVHVEGHDAPTVSGVPAIVPLRVRSQAYGDQDTAGYLKLAETGEGESSDRERARSDLARFKDLYRPERTLLHVQHEMERVRLGEDDVRQEAE